MTIPWQRITAEEFAGFERILGQQIILSEGTHWSRVRPLFYRPMLLLREYQVGSIKAPPLALLGGFQHAVPPGEKANSSLHCLLFENADAYTIDHLDYNRRRQVKMAAKKFAIRPVADVNEFKQKVYPIYLSFYERTGYRYGSQRRNQAFFSRWSDALFQVPGAIILGGYNGRGLRGISVSFLLEDTVCYEMFFCDTESLRMGLPDLMLHAVREAVAGEKCARQIFAGLYKGGKGVDDFYLLRGCHVVGKPAFLHVNPVAALFLKCFQRRQYNRLLGRFEDPRNPSPAVAKGNSAGNPARVPDSISPKENPAHSEANGGPLSTTANSSQKSRTPDAGASKMSAFSS